MDLQEGLFKFLKTLGVELSQDRKILLAVSGGLDSVVMAHLFQHSNLPFAVAHCNFQLRGMESDEDECFVEKIALQYEVPFFVKRFETKDYAAKNGLSTQMAARELRYDWFDQIAAENGFAYIATAHHLNDSVETALLNFIRGTGLAGLAGIGPKTKKILRPLLFATRADVLEYSKIHEISWREDSSNDADEYARNFVRHHILPRLEDLNSNFIHTAARNMTRISEAGSNLTFLLIHWLGISTEPADQIMLEKAKLLQLPSPEQALREGLKPYGFDAEQARQIAANLEHTGLELESKTGFKLLIDRQNILISSAGSGNMPSPGSPPEITIQEDDLMLRLPDGSSLFFQVFEAEAIPDFAASDPHTVLVDAAKLKFPLHLRHWRPGDTIQPLGMDGKTQKLQDFFTNHKLSRFEKEKVWLLYNADGTLIWILGMRQDERFKLHKDSNKILKINWIK